MHRELTRLDRHLATWREGAISSVGLGHRIYEHKTRPPRELYNRCWNGSSEMKGPYAIVTGLLDRKTLPAEVLQALERQLAP